MTPWQDIRKIFWGSKVIAKLILFNVMIFVGLIIFKVFLHFSPVSNWYQSLVGSLALPASLPKLLLQPWSLLSYAFTQEDPLHLLFNLLFLYWFGSIIEEYIGGSRLVNLYILGAIAGGLLFIICFNVVPFFQPKVPSALLMGASASTFAIVWAAATLLPHARFHLLFIGAVPIRYIAWAYTLLAFVQLTSDNSGGNIAHIGGAMIGYLYIKLLYKGIDMGSPVQAVLAWFKPSEKTPEPSKPVYSEAKAILEEHEKRKAKTTITASSSTQVSGDLYVSQEEVDELLDKISKSGYESLTKEQKLRLFKASKQ